MARHDRAPGVFELEIEREGLDYRAGDCTLLIRSDRVDSRPYSFSSHPDEDVLRFLVRKMGGEPERSFSQWLSGLGPGDDVGVGTPFGWFHPGTAANEVWFATGTGISPFLAVLRGQKPFRPREFFIGARTLQDAVLKDWLDRRCAVTWAFSREGVTPQRISAQGAPVGPEIQYYLCGHQRMIQAVASQLTDRGVVPSCIHEELFFQ